MSLETEDFELADDTTAIQGFWLDLGSKVVKDSGWIRIEWLVDNRLEMLAHINESAEKLFRNPLDKGLWHYYLVSPGMLNNSPPALEKIEKERARELFGDF